ncbi:MAG: hypothetical protein ACRD3S_02805 [Terracidiphilus sp.]
MKTAEWSESRSDLPARPAADSTDRTANPDRDLIGALAGKQANRECAVAEKARRVVRTSFGVMEDQKAGRRRSRALAISALLLMLFALGPFAWHLTEDLIGGEHMTDIATQTSLWICILCPAVLAAVIVAGWARSRQ